MAGITDFRPEIIRCFWLLIRKNLIQMPNLTQIHAIVSPFLTNKTNFYCHVESYFMYFERKKVIIIFGQLLEFLPQWLRYALNCAVQCALEEIRLSSQNRGLASHLNHYVLYSMKLFINLILEYSCVPNRRVGQNKRAGGKILKKH